ncbi:ABC transporter [Cryobacterium sp. LW097]|uniref:ABC transporter ATP-binding protein n=1 Tax=unclassified Cryobacterium TaxID=2649013 RepID=UPI000B4CEF1B|nr:MULTISPECIES: ABC transporter ATP-binding protein [unclassified Cryobacterium]ASD20756.1 ABC transporter [Cryobacterium sp. LW097]TFC88264.1 ABC transporter ATP-binding protein [Cryobacterium sp. TMT4-31]
MSPVVLTRDLTKRFGRVQALAGLDLSVAEGEVHGFVGPNGAGKSTTIRILLGLMRAGGGSASVLGGDPWVDASALHRRIAYVPGDVSLWPNLSGGEAIDLLARLRGARTADPAYQARRRQLLERFQLDPTKKGRTYSTGNRQKVALVAALAVPADLLILDEPTSGLDPLMDAVFRAEIVAAAADGATVLLSSHILSEVERLCDRVSIIRSGRIIETGTLAELRHLTRTEVAFAAAALTDAQLAGLAARLPGARDLSVGDDRVSFTVDAQALPGMLPVLAELRVQALTVAPPTLESLFLRHYDDASAAPNGPENVDSDPAGAHSPQHRHRR